MRPAVLALTFVVFSFSAVAQYPGQYPPSGPGQYPPGQYPGGYPPGQGPMPGNGGGLSIPRRQKKGQKQQAENAQPNFTAEGRTVTNDGKQLVIDTDDGRTITTALTSKTRWTRSKGDITANQVVPRSTVHIEALEDDQMNLTALSVDLLKDPPQEAAEAPPSLRRAPTATAVEDRDQDQVPAPVTDRPADAPDRPVLRRGGPKTASAPEDAQTDVAKAAPPSRASAPNAPKSDAIDFTIDSDAPKSKEAGQQGLVGRAKEWAMGFTEGLPNFVCQQMTTRYMEQSRSSGWEAQDVITAKVIYEDGREKYEDITVGGKHTNKNMLEVGGGSTSTGEFASTLQSLFSGNRAEFSFYQSSSIRQVPVAIYDFKVPLPRSDWYIRAGGQVLHPAYSGSVWIEKATGQVRRIEMQAENEPKDFPFEANQWAVDYDAVQLGGKGFLLPVHAEFISCQRGSSICTKNALDFRDYHKYTGESTVTFK
ncbi:MAG: hypothetical protein JO108_21270 [Acidobacteriaceae bacterium]|nr:hypothetical protein [Acidobacteriaceae bacterium]